MAVAFVVSIEKIGRSQAILDAVGRSLGVDSRKEMFSLFTSMGAKKALKAIQKGTKPEYVRFYNPDPVTEVCQGLEGTRWKVGDSAIQVPPLHWNCKSVLIYE